MECSRVQEDLPSSALLGGHSTFFLAWTFFLRASTSSMVLGSTLTTSSQAGRSQSSLWKRGFFLFAEGAMMIDSVGMLWKSRSIGQRRPGRREDGGKRLGVNLFHGRAESLSKLRSVERCRAMVEAGPPLRFSVDGLMRCALEGYS